MSIETITVTGKIREFEPTFKFFFVKPDDLSVTGGVEVWTAVSLLKSSAITGKISAGMTITVEAHQQPDGRWRTDRILELDGRPAASSAKTAQKAVPVMSKSKKSKAAAVDILPQLIRDHFVNAREIDRNSKSGEVLYVVKTTKGEFVRYIVGDLEGCFVRNLSLKTLREARLAIGKTYDPPRTEGRKTNDPTVSQAMKGSSVGGGKKNQAA